MERMTKLKLFSAIIYLVTAGMLLINIRCQRVPHQVVTVYTSSRAGERLAKEEMTGFTQQLQAGVSRGTPFALMMLSL